MDVHHINGNKLDNRLTNIMPLTRQEHEAIHGRKIFTE
ncbi:MAG: HNH endonuclease [Bacteroidales bacterium]|nr:HNH endonuclease [Bacteroidales bacterium]